MTTGRGAGQATRGTKGVVATAAGHGCLLGGEAEKGKQETRAAGGEDSGAGPPSPRRCCLGVAGALSVCVYVWDVGSIWRQQNTERTHDAFWELSDEAAMTVNCP